MKTVLFLVLGVTLAGTLSACGVTYEERQTAYAPGYGYQRSEDRYYREQPAYFPQRTYYSRGDYYRHYNGIDG